VSLDFELETSTAPIIVISREHKLLPLAHRLRNVEHYPTDIIVWKRSFEHAWEGMLDKSLLSSKREIHSESVSEIVTKAREGNAIVVHDVPNLEDAFHESSGVYGIITTEPNHAPIRLGFWWDGHTPLMPHLLVYDMGAWPGGAGRMVPGAVTLIDLHEEPAKALWTELFTEEARRHLEALDFKGLANAGLVEQQGKLALAGWELGWPALHTQAFMGALDGSWTELLVRQRELGFKKTFTVALPVSVPPWPGSANSSSQGRGVKGLVIDLNSKLHKYVYWHDVMVNLEEKTLYTAGLDGLIGIIHANGNSLEYAKQMVLGIAGTIGLEEKQFRPDIGNGVRLLEAQLEEHYGVYF